LIRSILPHGVSLKLRYGSVLLRILRMTGEGESHMGIMHNFRLIATNSRFAALCDRLFEARKSGTVCTGDDVTLTKIDKRVGSITKER
jgi:hypothetical protein